MSQPTRANRLAGEKSPYLLQHADNPVDWHPWSEEAFEKARREEKPIFLSIGYSTCHWCHVMERESFENQATADLLNKHFVSIKVDREERPDVDALYMQAVMAMTGQGGWPLSVFLTPELKPFYGGTYFPPEDRWGRPGFPSVLRGVAQAWETRREEIRKSGEEMAEALRQAAESKAPAGGELTAKTPEKAFGAFSAAYDETHGGFDPAPKFPRSHALSFLLRYWKRTGDEDALKIVEHTLRAMAAGGMYDHLGGGFHRYSTDAEWRVPHFEKMLYDQALLATTYLEAFQATGKEEYARTAREIFDYCLRDMAGPEGGFYSAEDADSLPPIPVPFPKVPGSEPGTGGSGTAGVKREGAFYVWTAEELRKLLGPDLAEIFGYAYGVRDGGNAAHDPQGELAGQNILHLARTAEETASKFGRPEAEVSELLRQAKQDLSRIRAARPRPHLDDKVLTDWNGLMISALALGSQALGEPRYKEAAERAARFILRRLVTEKGRPFDPTAHPEPVEGERSAQGRLLHRYRDGEAGIPGTLEDYAFFVHGLVDLYQTTFDASYLKQARRLTREMVRLFWDEANGGFFLTGTDAEQLLARQKEIYDGAIPSGNSVAALDLLRVGRMTAGPELEGKAAKLMRHFSGQVEHSPSAYPQLLIALDFALGPSREVVIAGSAQDPAVQGMLREVCRRFLPNTVLLLHPPGEEGRAIEELAPYLKGLKPVPGTGTVPGTESGLSTAYVCRNYACGLPTADVKKFAELLDE